MEEKQVTIGETSYPLPDPFFVLATENPIEHEGTYSLPEAELDRFLMKLLVTYPLPEEELAIVKGSAPFTANTAEMKGHELSPVLDGNSLGFLRSLADSIHIDEEISEYIVSIVTATRPASTRLPTGAAQTRSMQVHSAAGEGVYRYVSFGASPRASIALYRCSRIFALFDGRGFVNPEDVKAASRPVLRHRIVLSYEAEAEGLDADAVISRILSHVPVP
jgi:MoxR-like ATPase